jgi:NADPH:quinone reductase-like Zn-dependent oxidoreductase
METKKITNVLPSNDLKEKRLKSIVLTNHSSNTEFNNFKVVEGGYPSLENENQVIVRVKAAGVNYIELMQRQGSF